MILGVLCGALLHLRPLPHALLFVVVLGIKVDRAETLEDPSLPQPSDIFGEGSSYGLVIA